MKRKVKSSIDDLDTNCNSGKDLSKSEGYNQLVKYKNTEMYLYYIYL